MIEARMRNRIPQAELEEKKGKILTEQDYNIRLTGPARILRPDGQPLAVYLPGAIRKQMDEAYPILTRIRLTSDNRGLASGTKRVNAGGNRTRAMPVMSSILGSIDATPRRPYCRLNAYSRDHLDRWQGLFPLFQAMSFLFRDYVPERFGTQFQVCEITHEDWLIPKTVFTTITINNTYSTGVHTDKGDLDQGFSCLGVARKGEYQGGLLTFPEYRVAVDMQHGDLMLMDAHEWHGNTAILCNCERQLKEGPCDTCGAERISVVAYYRSNMIACGSKPEEDRKYHELLQASGT